MLFAFLFERYEPSRTCAIFRKAKALKMYLGSLWLGCLAGLCFSSEVISDRKVCSAKMYFTAEKYLK